MAITTGKIRLSFCHVWEPQVPPNGKQEDAKYSVTLLIPKTDTATLNAIYAEMAAAEQQGVVSKWNGVKPPIVKNPLYDGDGVRPSSGEPFGEECKGHMVMTASCKNQPSVVDLQLQPIINRADLYSGCYARVNINFFPYAQSGNRGIGCGLNCIQKIEDGEPLAGTVSAAEAFGGVNAYGGTSQPGTAVQQPTYGAQAQQLQMQYNASVMPYGTPAQQQPPYATKSPAQQPQIQYNTSTTSYGTPAQQPPYNAQPQQAPFGGQVPMVDPITGQPMITGGVMGLS